MKYKIADRKFISVLLLILTLICSFSVFCGADVDAAEILNSGDFMYKVLDDGKSVQITDYRGQSLYVSIPSEIDNCTVTSIGSAAFMSNTVIKELEISDTITSIGANAFSDCTSLKMVQIPGNVETIGKSAFQNCTSLNEVTIYDGVVNIDDYAFSGCSSLESITIPNSVDVIGDCVFFNCQALSDVEIPKALKQFGGYVLEGTQWIKNQKNDYVIVGDGILVKYNGDAQVENLPTQVKVIGSHAFAENNTINTVLIPSSVTRIDASAFENCTALSFVNMPDTITGIGERAFYNCTSLNDITLSTSLTKISTETFANCKSLKMIIVPAKAVTICKNAFLNCTSLESVKLQKGLKKTETGAFENCTSLQRMIFPETLKDIPSSVFVNCNSLTRAEFNGDTHIASLAFSDCKNLTEAVFYKNVTSLEEDIFRNSPDVVIYSDNSLYLEQYAEENGYKSEHIRNLKDYESKGIIKESKEEKTSVFSGGYTLIAIVIIIVDVILVAGFSMYILSYVQHGRRMRKKGARARKRKIKISEN